MSGEVVLLQRTVYGLRQAGSQRGLRLSGVFLHNPVMEQSKADPRVFRKVLDEDVTLIVRIHVHDLVVTVENEETLDAF